MKLRKEVAEAKRKVLDMYPTAGIRKYHSPALGGRYAVFVPHKEQEHNGMWLESSPDSSPTKEKAWLDAHKYILIAFLNMLHY